MNLTDAFDDFWHVIRRNEDYLMTYGQHHCSDWNEKSHRDLVDAYRQVQHILAPVSRHRMFDGPGDVDRFSCNNYHEALIEVLNPPEQWFRQLWVLNSPEYLALKSGAQAEEDTVLRAEVLVQAESEKRNQIKSRKPRSKPKVDELFGQSKLLVLNWLLRFHGNTSGNPSNNFLTGTEIAQRMTEEGTRISQPTVSRAITALMEEVEMLRHLRGTKKYERLCDTGEICPTLNELQLKSNRFLDRLVRNKLEMGVEDIDCYDGRGY